MRCVSPGDDISQVTEGIWPRRSRHPKVGVLGSCPEEVAAVRASEGCRPRLEADEHLRLHPPSPLCPFHGTILESSFRAENTWSPVEPEIRERELRVLMCTWKAFKKSLGLVSASGINVCIASRWPCKRRLPAGIFHSQVRLSGRVAVT